jgi:putative ABC transport system permease protein
MILLAIRNLVTERTRFAFSAAGIGFAVFLITILLGLYQGWNNRVGAFVEQVDADAWVAREGTTDFINAASILPRGLEAELNARADVAAVHPLIVRPMAFERPNGDRFETQLVGYDLASGVAGPPDVIRGRGEPGPGEIVIDDVLSRVSGVGIGDTLTFGGTSIEVIGIASGGNFAFTQASFVDVGEAAALLDMGDAVTFWLVSLEEGASVEAFQAEFQAEHAGLTVFTSDEFASATRSRILDNVIPIIALILGLAFIVGIAITSLTIYTATVERAREFGVMKAIGFNNMDLYRLVLMQSMLTGVLGFIFGVALTLIISSFVDRLVAQFIVLVRPQDIAFVLVATVIMAAGAAIVPARRVGSVDPAVAFKG